RRGLTTAYEIDLTELDPAAVCLRRQRSEAARALTPTVEVAFDRFNRALSDAKRSLQIRGSELEGAHRHIAGLEEKLLKLKKYRRELKLLKEKRQTLRTSPERRVGQILHATYRLPERLAKTVWKRMRRPACVTRRSAAPSDYQKWF